MGNKVRGYGQDIHVSKGNVVSLVFSNLGLRIVGYSIATNELTILANVRGY